MAKKLTTATKDVTVDATKSNPKITVTFGMMTAGESFTADDYVGASQSERVALKTYSICTIRSIDGKQVHPLANQIEFEKVLERFDLTQLSRLVVAAQQFWVDDANRQVEGPAVAQEA